MSRIINNPTEIQPNDWIAFPFAYNAGDEKEVMVAQVSFVYPEDKKLVVHFLWGYKSMAEDIKFDEIIGVACENGDYKIKLYNGPNKFNIFRPEDEVLLAWQKKFEDR